MAAEQVKEIVKHWEVMRHSSHRQFRGKTFVLDPRQTGHENIKLVVDSV